MIATEGWPRWTRPRGRTTREPREKVRGAGGDVAADAGAGAGADVVAVVPDAVAAGVVGGGCGGGGASETGGHH